MTTIAFRPAEELQFRLRSLYDRCGYAYYKMNKFEEYDLYARNMDFLISDGVISFTDTNGKLMALKPDVTLSIVKNTKDDTAGVQKLYYHENVYRVSKGTRSFKEIMQMGLEALGDVDDYTLYEVLRLAADSLKAIERRCVLEISHLGLLSELMSHAGLTGADRDAVLRCIGEKNRHELTAVCRKAGVSEEEVRRICAVASLSGTPGDILPKLEALLDGAVQPETLRHFVSVIGALNTWERADMLRIDFSGVGDPRYYNGFVFLGYVEGIPTSVLSGGQYDVLMRKMGRKSGAVGFAVYLDLLERSHEAVKPFDYDTVILYDDGASIADIERISDKCMAAGETVCVQKQLPEGKTYGRLIRLRNGEVERCEHDA